MKAYDYDIIILGGGGAGITAALLAKGLGKKALLIDRKSFGGECTWSGCVPSKALIQSAKVSHYITNLNEYGLKAAGISFKSDAVMDSVQEIVQDVYQTESGESFSERGISAMENASAKFLDSHTISANGKKITAKKFVIATGSSPLVPPIKGLDGIPYFTNETIFSMKSLPRSMAVLGGGPIGVELAQAFGRLGVAVTILEMAGTILFREDEEIAALLAEKLLSEGITVKTGARVVQAGEGKKIQLDYETASGMCSLQTDSVLVALGRIPNTENLGLDAAGVAFTASGITVNSRMQTSAKNIYAAGDAAGPYRFSHMANYQAVIAASNALLPLKRKADYRHVPWCTFTDPELARSGLTEKEAEEKYGGKIRVYRCEYRKIDRAVTDRAELGLAKVICSRKWRIAGIHILGERAGEVMHELHLAKSKNIPLHRLRTVIHAYPCYSDLVKNIANSAYVERIQESLIVRAVQFFRGLK